MAGVIKLGTKAAQRDYTLKAQGEGVAWRRGPADPFASQVNSSGEFDEVDIWNEWVQENWQAGVGRVDPLEGGFLYGEAETRVPKQIILPPKIQVADKRKIDGTTADCRFIPDNIAGTIIVSSSGPIHQVAVPFTTPASLENTADIFFLIKAASNTGVICRIYSDSGGAPGALITSNTAGNSGPDATPALSWVTHNFSTSSLNTSTLYWLSIQPNFGTLELAYASSGYQTAAQSYNATTATWSAMPNTYPVFMLQAHYVVQSSAARTGIVRFNGETYLCAGNALHKFVPADNNWASVGTITGTGNVMSAVVFGPEIHFGRSTGNYTTMSTAESFTAESVTRKLFLSFKGLLYGTWGNLLYYTNDGSTWSGPYAVGGADVEIRGLAGMGDSVYLATDKALMRFAPGNVVEEISRFGSEDETNGVGMIEYNGRLYIPIQGRLFRFDPSGQMQDIWISGENDLSSSRVGSVATLARMNNWLVALVVSPNNRGRFTLWMWQEEGWHFLANIYQHFATPNAIDLHPTHVGILYDRENSRLWAVSQRFTRYLEIDDYTLNPYNANGYLYMPQGWVEQDKFYGGQYLIDKDWESVTIVGDNLAAGRTVKVYWQDEGSTTGWELLGTADSDGEELRWDSEATRPQGKWIRLALLLSTNDGDETPRVRAVVVKFLPMATDRIQDSITLTLKDYIEMPDGKPDTYKLSEQVTHIEGIIGSVIPIIYQDPLGVMRECKVVDHSWTAIRYDHINATNVVREIDVMLVLRQTPDGTYTAP